MLSPMPLFIQYESDHSGLTAYLLCLSLGNLGVHRFYTGHYGTGLLMLLTGGGFGLWWIVDLILIATNQFEDKYGRRLIFTQPNGRWPMPALISTAIVPAIVGVTILSTVRTIVIGLFATLPSAIITSGMGSLLTGAVGVLSCVFSVGMLAFAAKRYFNKNPATETHSYQKSQQSAAGIYQELGIDPKNTLGHRFSLQKKIHSSFKTPEPVPLHVFLPIEHLTLKAGH